MTLASAGGSGSWDAVIYRELRAQAARHMRAERAGHTLQPTALVNEAYIRLASSAPTGWESRTRFLAAAASTFRRVLVDHARRRRARKRRPEGGLDHITRVDSAVLAETAGEPVDLLHLDELLVSLAGVDARSARVVEMKFFGGLTHQQIGEAMGVSASTVEQDWRFARAWLLSKLKG
jgi:RNA polymerase sigma-70 factor (ECF subfamily)